MKCFVCKKEITNELEMKMIGVDGDFVCNNVCKQKYESDKNEFFNNIGNDAWYEKNYFPLNKK